MYQKLYTIHDTGYYISKLSLIGKPDFNSSKNYSKNPPNTNFENIIIRLTKQNWLCNPAGECEDSGCVGITIMHVDLTMSMYNILILYLQAR